MEITSEASKIDNAGHGLAGPASTSEVERRAVSVSSAGYPMRSLEEFAQFLIKHGFLDECAYYDSDGYDVGKSLARLSKAFQELAADNKQI